MQKLNQVGHALAAVAVAVGVAVGSHILAELAIPHAPTEGQAPRIETAAPAPLPSVPQASVAPSLPTKAPEPPADFATLLASANPDAGKAFYVKSCAACHSADKGKAAKVGPNLYGIVGAKHAHAPDFKYSDAMKALNGKTWTFEALDEYLRNPKAAIPGNRMAYAGLKNDKDRANVVAWLRTLSDKPEPLPMAKK